MLRILHIDSGREWRGGQSQVFDLLRTLRDEPDLEQILCSPHASPLALRSAKQGFEVISLSMRSEIDFRSVRALRRVVQERSVDIVHTHDSRAHGVARRALRPLREVKLVVHRRVDFRVRTGWLGRSKYGSSVTKFVAISNGVAEVLVDCKIPREKIEIIFSGIDVEKFRGVERTGALRRDLGIPEDAPLIGNIGMLEDHKGHVYLADAMTHVLKKMPDAHCVIVGEGSQRAELERRIATGGAAERVHLAGWRDDIGACLADFDLFCLSSTKEGLCTSLLDATLFDLPLVAFEAGGVPDIVIDGETGWLVPNRDVEGLGRSIVEALTCPDEAAKRTTVAKGRTLDLFNVEKTAKKTLALWRHLAS